VLDSFRILEAFDLVKPVGDDANDRRLVDEAPLWTDKSSISGPLEENVVLASTLCTFLSANFLLFDFFEVEHAFIPILSFVGNTSLAFRD